MGARNRENNMPESERQPEIDQAEIDREIAELLGESANTEESAEENQPAEAPKQPAAARQADPAPTPAEKPKPELKASPTMPSSFRLNMPSNGGAAPADSSASFAKRHPLLMAVLILGLIGGIITIFAVSLKTGLFVIGGTIALFILGLLCLAFRKHPVLTALALIIMGVAAYFFAPVSRCCDGSWSFSKGSGTCSHHGGMVKTGCDACANMEGMAKTGCEMSKSK